MIASVIVYIAKNKRDFGGRALIKCETLARSLPCVFIKSAISEICENMGISALLAQMR